MIHPSTFTATWRTVEIINISPLHHKFNQIFLSKGTSSILHDSESTINVDKCYEPGCYSRQINYNASEKQIAALAELSSECHQSIRVKNLSNSIFESYSNQTKFSLNFNSMTALWRNCISKESTMDGGTTPTENPDTFGRATKLTLTPASAESNATVTKENFYATATRLIQTSN